MAFDPQELHSSPPHRTHLDSALLTFCGHQCLFGLFVYNIHAPSLCVHTFCTLPASSSPRFSVAYPSCRISGGVSWGPRYSTLPKLFTIYLPK